VIAYSLVASCFVLLVSFVIQWLVYDDWLHETGPLRIVGTGIAAALTFVFVLRWQMAAQQREAEMVHRLELVLRMNDRIRNALQAMECLTYISHPEATEAMRQSANDIDAVLREVLEHVNEPLRARPLAKSARASTHRKSA
jgi:hypothetical protein